MTATAAEVDPTAAAIAAAVAGQDPDRQAAEITALEAVIVATVLARLRPRLDGITAQLRAAFEASAVAAPVAWALARRRAATALRATRVDVARPIAKLLPRAAALGARHVGGPLPDGHDPASDELVAGILDRVDGLVRDKLSRAAQAATDGPVATDAQVAAVLSRVDAAARVAEIAAGDATTRAVAGGAAAAADELGISLVWIAEPGACPACIALAGSVREPGGKFRGVGGPPLPWGSGLVEGPPGHPSCRCWVMPSDLAVSDRLRRRYARRVALGPVSQFSTRLRALDRLLRSGRVRLPRMQDRAAVDRARGRYTRR